MIYTVTLNPSLDYIVSVRDFKQGFTNRTDSELILPGGKGINVSVVLKNLGMESTALGFTAGFTGEEIVRRLVSMGLKTEFIRLSEGVSRINIKLKSSEGTEINGQGPGIGEKEMEALMEQLGRLEAGDTLFLAGSIPSSMPGNIYRDILEKLRNRNLRVVVDAAGDLLSGVLEYHPFLIKPNHHELGELFGVELHTAEEVIPYGRRLQELGAQNVLISMAGAGAVLLAGDGSVYTASAPEGELRNSVGAGDSMVAGFMTGWLETKDYGHAFRMGVAAGSASAFSDFLATGEEIRKIYARVVSRELPSGKD